MWPLADAQDWLIGSQIAAAAGTLVLSGIAAWTARAASRTAQAAEDQVRAQVRPLLIDVEPHVVGGEQIGGVPVQRLAEEIRFPDGYAVPVRRIAGLVVGHARDQGYYLSVPLRNVGAGIALIRSIELVGGRYPGQSAKPNVPPGEHTRVNFVVRNDEQPSELDHFRSVVGAGFWSEEFERPAGPMREPPWEGEGVITLAVAYTDLAGRQPTRTRVDVLRDRETGRWQSSL